MLAALSPATLLLEDLHWADPATCELLAYLSTHPVEGLAVVLTARTAAPGSSTPIHDALARTPPWSVTRVRSARWTPTTYAGWRPAPCASMIRRSS